MIGGLEEAVAGIGGVRYERLAEQMMAVILEYHRHEGGKLPVNAERFACHGGFRIQAPAQSRQDQG